MCYNLVVVRDLLSWLWKLGECDVSPLRVSEALNIILTYTGTYCWTGSAFSLSFLNRVYNLHELILNKKEPKTEVKVVILLKQGQCFSWGILGSLNKVLCQCLKSWRHTCTQTFLECPPGVIQTLNGKFVSIVMCREPDSSHSNLTSLKMSATVTALIIYSAGKEHFTCCRSSR